MLYKDFLIERPKNTKIIGKKGENRYIYHVTGKVYNKKTKFADDKKRICIGKMVDDSHFMPNDNYFDIYGNSLGLDLVENPQHSDTLKIGAFMLIRKVMNDLGLSEILEDVHGYEGMAMISDLISYMMVKENSSFQHFHDFMFDHYGANVSVRQDTFISQYLKTGLKEKDMKIVLSAWNKINNERDKKVYISYDSTNMNTTSKGITLAEYGHAKVDEGLPQVNVSYVVKQENCRPLFYEVYPGSIVDNVEFEYMIQKAEEYGYENIGVILDRGYYSKRNIDALRKHGFIMMVKTNNEVIQKSIEKHMIQLKNLNGYLKEHLLSCASEHIKLFKGDKEKTYVHIYYDDIRAAEERKICELGIIKMEEDLERLVEKKITTKEKTERYQKLFNLEYDANGYLQSYKRNDKSVRAAKEKLGFFSIISDSESKAEEVIEIYRNRDQIEKMFMMVKSGFDMNKFGVQSDAAMNSKIYLAFIGSIVRSEINQRLRALRETNRKEYTVPSALNALENVEVTRNTKGTYIRRYALTAKQKNIFNLFGIDEMMINEEVAKLNKMYK